MAQRPTGCQSCNVKITCQAFLMPLTPPSPACPMHPSPTLAHTQLQSSFQPAMNPLLSPAQMKFHLIFKILSRLSQQILMTNNPLASQIHSSPCVHERISVPGRGRGCCTLPKAEDVSQLSAVHILPRRGGEQLTAIQPAPSSDSLAEAPHPCSTHLDNQTH